MRMKAGRAIAGAARFVQQPQLRQVHGAQRQPPLLQVQDGLVFSVLIMVILLCLPCGETVFNPRTVVRSQA
jgi:hypothetical protein